VWDRGDAAFPLDQRLPRAAKAAALVAMAPATVIDASGGERSLPAGTDVEPGDALVVATSGASGTPKGVVLTHDAVAASARATNTRLGVTADDHWLACLPLSHVGGLSVVTRALAGGTRLTVLPGFDPVAVTAAGATLVSLVATALQRIDPAVFRTIVLGGAAPPPDRPANVVTTYGMTETGSGLVYDGRPLDGVEVRIDGDGEISVRGPMLLRAYRDGTVPLDDGWFATGDVGRWDADGRLVVDGRRSELIISGGENVWPEPVEAVLRGHPGVADVAVGGEPDLEWGQVVTAYVVATGDPPTLEELRDAVKEQLAPHCAPRRLTVVAAIPRTALGKIRRAEVTKLAVISRSASGPPARTSRQSD
jgi:O-succinylbenzoic acid--CoA ligase